MVIYKMFVFWANRESEMVSIGQSFSVIAYGKMEKYLFTNNRKYMFFLYIEFNNTGIDIGFSISIFVWILFQWKGCVSLVFSIFKVIHKQPNLYH